MQLTGLGTMALINKNENVILGAEVRRQRSLQFLYVPIIIFVAGFASALAELMNQGAEKPVLVGIQARQQIRTAPGANDGLIYAFKILFNLLVQLVAVCND